LRRRASCCGGGELGIGTDDVARMMCGKRDLEFVYIGARLEERVKIEGYMFTY